MKIDTSMVLIQMAKNCLTMRELAVKAGISCDCMYKLFEGKRNPKPATIGKIAKALDVDVETLLEK